MLAPGRQPTVMARLVEGSRHASWCVSAPRTSLAGAAPVGDDGSVDDYELVDAGDGGRLERFGPWLVDRPHGGALAPRHTPDAWRDADLRFDRDVGWSGPGLATAREAWSVHLWDLRMLLRPTDAGQVGVYPEHATRFGFLAEEITERRAAGAPVEVLHLFGYTGLATLAMAGWGAVVTHVDASRPAVVWARQNAAANGLGGQPIRWIVDDARAYVRRESRRGHRYDGIVLDPPSYGHGGTRAPWRIEADLPALLRDGADLLRDEAFVLLTSHSEEFGPDRLGEALVTAAGGWKRGLSLGHGEIVLAATSGARLELGAYATLRRRT